MRLVVQKVSQSSVKIEGEIVGAIDKGYMVLVGITNGDDELLVEKMVDKLVNLRIFEDENDKLKKKLETLRNGLSFKIGRFLTFVPRKIIDFTRK